MDITSHRAIARASRPSLNFTTLEVMLILLPPSEGKAPASKGEPVDFAELSFPELTEARELVAKELMTVSSHYDAPQLLKVGKTLSSEIIRNQRILAEPAAAAAEVYTGVLYEALDYSSFTAAQKQRADSSILVISALWGALKLTDRIPAYRLSMGIRLGECGNLATFWRGELSSLLADYAQGQLIIDCRSAAYSNAWKPPQAQTYLVRVEQVQKDDSRKVVSHFAKHYRGLLARYLIMEKLLSCDSIEKLSEKLSFHWTVEITPATPKQAGILTLVVPAPPVD